MQWSYMSSRLICNIVNKTRVIEHVWRSKVMNHKSWLCTFLLTSTWYWLWQVCLQYGLQPEKVFKISMIVRSYINLNRAQFETNNTEIGIKSCEVDIKPHSCWDDITKVIITFEKDDWLVILNYLFCQSVQLELGRQESITLNLNER